MSEQNTMNVLNQDALDKDSLLASLSLELMADSMQQQISGYIESTTDFLGIVLQKFNTILEDESIDIEDKTEIKHQMIDFCQNLIEDIAEKYQLAINLLSDGYDENIKLLETLYNFFVLNKYSNVEQFLIEYIRVNINALAETMNIQDIGKDITSMANKQRNLPKQNIIILSHVNDIVHFICNHAGIDNDEFLNILDVGEYYTSNLLQYCQDGTVSGEFAHYIIADVVGDDYDNGEYTRIRNEIRIAFSNADN